MLPWFISEGRLCALVVLGKAWLLASLVCVRVTCISVCVLDEFLLVLFKDLVGLSHNSDIFLLGLVLRQGVLRGLWLGVALIRYKYHELAWVLDRVASHHVDDILCCEALRLQRNGHIYLIVDAGVCALRLGGVYDKWCFLLYLFVGGFWVWGLLQQLHHSVLQTGALRLPESRALRARLRVDLELLLDADEFVLGGLQAVLWQRVGSHSGNPVAGGDKRLHVRHVSMKFF